MIISFFFQTLVCISFLFFYSSLSHGHSGDLEALLKLKKGLVGPQGSGLEDWEASDSSPHSSQQHCSFSGVTCNEESRVTSLNLTNLPLFGYLPPEIGLLNKLVNLTIACINLTGMLPPEMANLTSLKLFNISNNLFMGRFPGEVMVGMTELEVIDTYNNNFTESLPIELVKLKNLKKLDLGGNYFSGNIPDKYSELQSLEYLGLNGNSLTGKFPASLSQLKNLKEMYVGYDNNYDGGIPPELGLASSLQVLDMGGCNLTGDIPKSLGLLKNLRSLFLQINRLSGQIPSELSGLVSLEFLDLSINKLTGEIPESFSDLKNLMLINLFGNNFYGQIPEFIGELPNLEVFQVWENNFSFYLPERLGRNGKLKDLDVTNNNLAGRIPRDLCRSRSLKTLILMQNSFFGPIPDELGECKSLTKIRIMKNFFNGTIPAGIFMLPNVSIIELSGNHFSGELPSEMSGDSLKILVLSNNRISGNMPRAIAKLTNLQTLSLEHNHFDGEIPKDIFDLKFLSKINVSANNLTGKIPSSITRCSSLTEVDFSQNSLSGEIPSGISNLNQLGILNFSSNNLTGKILSEIQAMTSLTTLDLSCNNLSGKVPSGGQFLYFNDTSFAGNPYLCLRNNTVCLSSLSHKVVSSQKPNLIIIGVATPVSLSFLLLALFVMYTMRSKNLQKPNPWKLTSFKRLLFKAEDILECIKEENIIGRGGAGIVYLGSMPDGSNIAIKRLAKRTSGRMLDCGFLAEIQTLGQIRHRHIVRLLGYLSNKETNLLLYEYMPNGSLGELLHGPNAKELLQWEMRYKIALEAAKGLCYLHHDCSPRIIHRDVKSNNILLDSRMEAHVADFGLAKFLQEDGASDYISAIVGTFGYIAPEYTRTLKVDEKSDVYSFGVVLLELMAGKKPVGEYDEGVNIVGWVRKTTSELSKPSDDAAKVLAIVDPRLTAYPLKDVVHLFRVAILCIQDDSAARPTMRDVVLMLIKSSTSQS